jgi:hypothetical protein
VVCIDALNKRSIKGPAIVPLQPILLVAAVSDIHILPFWIPERENMVADAASRYDYKKLADLGMQVFRDLPRPATLRRKLHSFFTTPSLQALNEPMARSLQRTNSSATNITTPPTLPPSEQSRTGSHISSPPSSLPPQNPISAHSSLSTFKQVDQRRPSEINTSTSSSKEESVSMGRALKPFDTQLHPTFSSEWSERLRTTKMGLISKQPSAWALLPSYDLENLRGILGPRIPSSPPLPQTHRFSNRRLSNPHPASIKNRSISLRHRDFLGAFPSFANLSCFCTPFAVPSLPSALVRTPVFMTVRSTVFKIVFRPCHAQPSP